MKNIFLIELMKLLKVKFILNLNHQILHQVKKANQNLYHIYHKKIIHFLIGLQEVINLMKLKKIHI